MQPGEFAATRTIELESPSRIGRSWDHGAHERKDEIKCESGAFESRYDLMMFDVSRNKEAILR